MGRVFDSGGYGESSLRDVLPEWSSTARQFQIQSTCASGPDHRGKSPSVTRLLPIRAEKKSWNKLPALNGHNTVRAARGEVLLTAGADGTGAPLPDRGRFGKGRTLAL